MDEPREATDERDLPVGPDDSSSTFSDSTALAADAGLGPVGARLRAILEVTHALVAAEDEAALLISIAEAACRTLDYDACTIALVDQQDVFRIRASYGASAQTLQALEDRPLSGPAYREIRRVATSVGTLSYLSPSHVGQLPGELASYLLPSGDAVVEASERTSTGLVVVPLIDAHGTEIGYLNPDRSVSQPAPNLDEALLLETLAQLAVVALNTTRARTAERKQRELAETRGQQLEALLRAGSTIRSSLRLDDILTEIAAAMTGPGGFRRIAIYLLDRETNTLHARASAGLDPDEAARMYETPVPRAQFDPLTRPEMQVGRSFLFDHRRHQLPPELLSVLSVVPDAPDWSDGLWHPLDSLTVPLLDPDGAEVGLLSVDEPVGRLFPDRAHIDALEFFADQCAIAVRQASAYRAVEARAHTDALTGLANRGAADEQLDRLLAAEPAVGVTVLFCDLDHFKAVNDEHGHAVGDRVLRNVARILGERVRPGDLVARYGGEEFLVVFAGITPSAAFIIADDLRVAVAESVLGDDPRVRTTLSIGVATTVGGDRSSLLKLADDALYEAKERGRNQVRQAR